MSLCNAQFHVLPCIHSRRYVWINLRCCLVAQSCLTLCDPMDCSLPGSSVHGIFQGRLLEWVTISFSKRSPDPWIKPRFTHIVGRCFTIQPPGKSGEESKIPKQIHSFINRRKTRWLAQGRTRCLPVTLSSLLSTKERCTS